MPFGASLLLLGLAVCPLRAGWRELETVEAAGEVVRTYADLPLRSIPPAMLQDARGVVIIPNVIKASFLFGGRFGRGVALARLPNGNWGEPVFVTLAGGGFGFQAGIQSTDVILVFKSGHSLDRILRGERKLTLGGDVGVAIGPVGRQAEAATDAQLRAEIYSYSRSRGLFAGVSLEGAGLEPDRATGEAFRRNYGTPEALAVQCLKGWLDRLSTPPPPPAPVPVAPQTPAPPLAPPVPVPPLGR
jgi:lipid-binding SYLF domain-containing protein